ncbi:hypothetical protein VBM87_00680 [Mycoplasma sp. 744]|uniref:MHO_1590 family protein n=1 Tax=unclassified Mycoplasma TaxID=2683645 RepID=UPI00211BCFED|nr:MULTISPECIES: hypothetical protein [unclassified Mycoplasma]MEA4115300.1 hypothetical protein [Mycoplasma sp. 744]UUM19302.1 hypothetical protein NPA14_00280 [Mycoplasma sp. 1018B]
MKTKWSLKKKIWITSILGACVVAITLPIALISTKSKIKLVENLKDKNIEFNNDKSLQYNIFPELNASDYYKYVRIEEDGYYFDSNIISSVAKDVINKIKSSEGKIYFEIEQPQDYEINFYFKWISNNNQIQYQNYYFNIYDMVDISNLME